MDAIVGFLPAPKEQEVLIIGEDTSPQKLRQTPRVRWLPWYFKTSADPYVGRLTYFRRLLRPRSPATHRYGMLTRNENERIGQLFILKRQEPGNQYRKLAPAISVRLLNCHNLHRRITLGAKDKPIEIVRRLVFPEPRYSEAVYPKTN